MGGDLVRECRRRKEGTRVRDERRWKIGRVRLRRMPRENGREENRKSEKWRGWRERERESL
jgi:hypothetical protein